MSLAPGHPAPDFALPDQHRGEIRLSTLLDSRAVLVVFFPFAFSGLCTGELNGFRDRLGDFETDDATLVTLSCDPVYTLRALADINGLFFPLLSDFWPHGATASAYGVLDEEGGNARRSSFLIDPSGIVRWSMHNDIGRARDLDAHAEAVQALG